MLRPKYLQRNIVAFITLALVILYITEPTLAQRTNRKNSESSGSEQAKQQQAEREKQQQAERERQQRAEQERQRQAERERQRQAEREKQQQAERERQQRAEQERQQQAERERQRQAEREKQQQAERERQQRAEQEKQQQAEQERQQQAERDRQRQAEREKQQQAERERQQRAEQEKQRQAEREKQQQAEQEKQQQAERERQRQAEREKQQQAERERQQRAEQEKQRQAERERQRQAERERQQRAEQEKQRQAEREKQQQAEREKQRQAEREKQQAERERQQRAEQERQRQAERERQRQAEREKQRQAEREKQQQAEREKQQQAEREKQQQTEREKQQQAERERQRQAERERQQRAEQEKQRQAERERQQQTERERQQQAERTRQQQQPERVNRKQLIISPNDRDLGLRTDDEMSGRVNRKLPFLPNNTKIVVVDNSASTASPVYRYEPTRPSRLAYWDRSYATDTYRREHIYVDYSSRICTRTIPPGCRLILGYDRGPWHTFRYFYPYYHRKYVFVSLDGYWPFNYRFIRYYWYGYHPYYWCGYYPVAHEVVSSSYNYYTYNYYYDDNPVSYQPTSTLESPYFDNICPQPAEEPVGVTPADIYFEEAVGAFEEGNYGLAIEKFAKAMELAPDDIILPFAYSQALFAARRYTEATEVLRSALAKITSDKEGVFYPRGLYPKDEVLLTELEMLIEEAELYEFDADLQLLLGYQLLGLGQLDMAVTPLQNASLDLVNTNAATILLGILGKIKTTEVQNEESATNYLESVRTAPETEGVETETNLMSDIKFDDTQASAIGPDVICWSFSAGFALMSLVSILCSCKSRSDRKTSCSKVL